MQQLVRALVLPRISYGMPVFAPTAAQSAKLATAVARGLHRMLGVENNPAAMPALVDNGLLSPEYDLQQSALRYAHRLWKARTARNPASDALVMQLQGPFLRGPHVHRIARTVRAAEVDFTAAFDAAKLDSKRITKCALKKQRTAAAASRASSLADEKERKAMLPVEGHATFLHQLSRTDACVMALFRYNRIRLNHVLHARGAAASAHCPFCPGVTESLRHALLTCPQYAAPRTSCFRSLTAMGVPPTYTVLLGAVEALHQDLRKAALNHIVLFLSKIREVRRV